MDRRRFLRHGSLAAMAGIGAAPRRLAGAALRKHATDRIRLGPAAVELSRLAMGTGTNGVAGSSNQTRGLGLQGVADLLRAAYDQGVTFWDSAGQYGTHPHLGLAMKGIPREKLTILSKTHASSEKEMRADLDRFRRELGTDYIDILLLHGMRSDDWPAQKRGAMAAISEAKEKGTVRTFGVSCHSLGALKTAAASPWVEVVLARINPAGTAMDAGPETVLEVLRRMKGAGKGIIGMKILGAGRLRSRIDECLGFALGQDCVDCFTIGSENRAEFEQLLRKIPEASVRA